jgi:hypothetical protein
VNKVSKLRLGWGSMSLKIFKMPIPFKLSECTQSKVDFGSFISCLLIAESGLNTPLYFSLLERELV